MNTQHPMGFKARQACLGGKPKVRGKEFNGSWFWVCELSGFERGFGLTPKVAVENFYNIHNGIRG